MTYRQYWHGKPLLAKQYRYADLIRRKRSNYEMWLQGGYIYEAFGVVMKNAFSKKGEKKVNYTSKPYDIFPKTKEEKEEEKKQEQEKIARNFERMRLAWEAKTKQKEVKDDG